MARQSMKISEARASQGPDALELPIPEPDEKDIKSKWKSRHDIVLGNGRLLIATLQGWLCREVTAKPMPRLSTYLIEQMRTLGCLDKRSAQALLILPSGPVRSQELVADVAKDHLQLFIRIRAFFSTMAYTRIADPSWFSYGDCEFVSDKIFGLIK